MIKLATLFWLVFVSATGFAMFAVKYEVQALDDELARTNKSTAAEEHEIRVLEAEWAYLTRPETLEDMNQRFLSLGPIATKQLRTTVADIPMRAPTPVPVEVAAVADPPAQETPQPRDAPPDLTALATPPSAAPTPAQEPAGVAAPAKPAPAAAKTPAKPNPPHRPKSLDDLFARVAASR